MYNEDALEIASNAKRFLDAGVDARHLRGWRVAANVKRACSINSSSRFCVNATPRLGAGHPTARRTRSHRGLCVQR